MKRAMASSVKTKLRLTADPSIGIQDLLECILNFGDYVGNQQVYKIIEPPPGISWKSSTSPTWLFKNAFLFKQYLGKAPNGVLPAKKHRTAIVKATEKRTTLNNTRKTNEEFADKVDEWARIGLAHLRVLKQSPQAMQRCFRKADAEEQTSLKELLDLLVLQENEELLAEGDACTAMVPRHEEPSEPNTPSPSPRAICDGKRAEKQQAPTLVLDPRDVFKMVLKRPSLCDESPPRTASTYAPSSGSSKKSHANRMPDRSHEKFEGFLEGLKRVGAVGETEADVLAEVQNQEPINKGCKSQLSRANKSLKAKAKEEEEEVDADNHKKSKTGSKTTKKENKKKGAKKVQKAALKKTKKSNVTPPHEETPQDTNEDEHSTAAMPAEVATSSKGKKKNTKTKKTACKPMVKPKKEIPKSDPEAAVSEAMKPQHLPEGADPKKSRAENRKLLTSRAYHHAADAHWAERPKDHVPQEYWEECKVKARQAAAQAGADFDQVWPRTVTRSLDVD